MMIETYNSNQMLDDQALKLFYQNKHILLIGIGMREKKTKDNTAFDIEHAFNISRTYAWKLLKTLVDDGLIEKSGQIKKKGRDYYNYKLTPQATQNLQVLSSWLLMFNISE